MRENGRANVERPPPRRSIELLSRYGLPKLSSSPESRNRKGNHVGAPRMERCAAGARVRERTPNGPWLQKRLILPLTDLSKNVL